MLFCAPTSSHAKFYLLRIPRLQKRYLLVTSANWSPSACGAGAGHMARIFELGVLIETDWKFLEEMREPLAAPYCNERPESGNNALHWAQASWDGSQISLLARSSDSVAPVRATFEFVGGAQMSADLVDGSANLPWTNPREPPLAARFHQGAATVEVPVMDLRLPQAFRETPLPEVELSYETALREAPVA